MKLKDTTLEFFKKDLEELIQVECIDREESLKKFGNLGFPNQKMEKWQKSDIKRALKLELKDGNLDSSVIEEAPKRNYKFESAGYVDLKNGFPIESSLTTLENGVIYGDLGSAIQQKAELVNAHLNKYIKEDLNGLNALNNALFSNGFFLFVPENVQMELPVEFFHSLSGDNGFFHLRNLIIVEKGSEVNLIQYDHSQENHSSLTNSVTEVFVGENASLKWYREESIGNEDTLINSVFANTKNNSRFKVLHFSLSGNIVRNDVHVKMDGSGCEADILGLYVPISGEQVDNQIFVDHAKPQCVSNELFKGVLDGNGNSIFNGHILVQQDAQQTNAYQTNRSIVLSDEASTFAKPFLEIYADDVKCSHGATIGQLDENAMFYLQSRGLSKEQARSFLIKAFLGEVIDYCDHESFREMMIEKVNYKLDHLK